MASNSRSNALRLRNVVMVELEGRTHRQFPSRKTMQSGGAAERKGGATSQVSKGPNVADEILPTVDRLLNTAFVDKEAY